LLYPVHAEPTIFYSTHNRIVTALLRNNRTRICYQHSAMPQRLEENRGIKNQLQQCSGWNQDGEK